MVTAFIVAVVVAVIPWIALPGKAISTYWMGTPAILNWSLPAVMLRVLEPPARGAPLPYNWEFGNVVANLRLSNTGRLISAGMALAILGAGAALLWIACRGRLNGKQLPWALVGSLSLGLAASPISWTHYQIMQYPGLAFLLSTAVRQRRWALAAWVLGCDSLLYQIPVAMLRAYYNQYGAWTAASPATLYVWTSVAPLACLSLFGVCLRNLREPG
jgi:hypothetical protein